MARSEGEEALRSSQKFYSQRAQYYGLLAQRQKDVRTPKELDFLEFAFRKHAAHRIRDVLDIACGGGRHIVGLARRGYKCTGYDLTPERIEVAKARAARARVAVAFGTGDSAGLNFNRAFDAVLGLYIVFLLPSDEKVTKCLRGVYRSLRSGGVFICNTFNPFTTGTHWIANAMKKKDMIDDQRARGIRITDIQRTRDYDPVKGVVWVDETTVIEAPDGRHIFRDRERARLLTYWDMDRYLKSVGFREISCYPDWQAKPTKKPKAEQLVFVTHR